MALMHPGLRHHLFLLLLGTLVAGGCGGREEAPRAEARGATLPAVQGVRSSLREVSPERFVIASERLVDSATVVLIEHLDGRVERIETAEAFAARLDVPDSLRLKVAAYDGPAEATAPDAPGLVWSVPETGLPLGTALFYTMAMNVWRPAAFAAILAPPPAPQPPVIEQATVAGAPARLTPRAPAPTRRVAPSAPRRESPAPRQGRGKGKGGSKRKGW